MKRGVSYFGNRMLKHVQSDLQDIRARGFTYVVHTFSEEDLLYYRQTMAEIVAASHDAGLEVHLDPWGVGEVFGGEAFSDWVAKHPEIRQVTSDGHAVAIACLNQPLFRDKMLQWIEAAASMRPEALFWDEPHLYIPSWFGDKTACWTCRCEVCRRLFEERYDRPMPQTRTAEVEAFRQETVLDFLRFVCAQAKHHPVNNAVCFLPEEFADGSGPSWEAVADLPGIDILGTDPYAALKGLPIREFVARYTQRILDLCRPRGLQSQIWIQGFKIPSGHEEDIREAIEAAVGAGATDLAFWGYEACAHLSAIRCGDPMKAWEVACEALRGAGGHSAFLQ